MAGRDSADRNSPGGFFDRVARQMPLSLHSAATLPFSPSLIQSQRLFLKFISALLRHANGGKRGIQPLATGSGAKS
jgi:hypothetical protein